MASGTTSPTGRRAFFDLVPEVPSQLARFAGQGADQHRRTGGETNAGHGAACAAPGQRRSHAACRRRRRRRLCHLRRRQRPLPANPAIASAARRDRGLIAAVQAAAPPTQPAQATRCRAPCLAAPDCARAAPAAPATTAPVTTTAATNGRPRRIGRHGGRRQAGGQVVVANPGAHVKLTARMDSWVQINDKAGKILLLGGAARRPGHRSAQSAGSAADHRQYRRHRHTGRRPGAVPRWGRSGWSSGICRWIRRGLKSAARALRSPAQARSGYSEAKRVWNMSVRPYRDIHRRKSRQIMSARCRSAAMRRSPSSR